MEDFGQPPPIEGACSGAPKAPERSDSNDHLGRDHVKIEKADVYSSAATQQARMATEALATRH